jgi:sporulation protein YlmC with PRC-barrel domain
MSESREFDIGSEVACSDGVCAVLTRVVLDPVARALTHLVVEPRHGQGKGHLVPIGRVVSAGTRIELNCTKAELQQFDDSQESQLVPAASGLLGYEPAQILAWPYYAGYAGAAGITGRRPAGRLAGAYVVSSDSVPEGEVDVRRGERVHATDGAIGQVKGLVIDPVDHRVTHFLLEEGHLWGQKRVAIPIGSVTRVDDGVQLSLTKDQVRELPAVELEEAGT